MRYTYKKRWTIEFKKYTRYEHGKNITFAVNEEPIKLFGRKIERIILYGSYAWDLNLESNIDIIIMY